MQRGTFFLISGIIAVVFGLPSLLFPIQATAQFGLHVTPEDSLVVRSLGGMILSMGVLYFLLRRAADSDLLKRILMYSTLAHIIGFAVSIYGMTSGLLPAVKLLPNLGVHLFMGAGSYNYWRKLGF